MTPPARRHFRSAAGWKALAAAAALPLLAWLAGCADLNATSTSSGGPDLVQVADTAASAPQAAASAALAAASSPEAGASAAAQQAVASADTGPAVAAPVDPLEPEQQVNLDDHAAQEDLWARVRQGFGMPTIDNDLVRTNEQWYATRPDYVQRMTDRGSRFLYHVVEEVEKRHMPTELALLPFVESAFNPQALSVAQASGMWQFVASTGRDYSLKQNIFRDDRRDVLASTRAALDYLDRLHDEFGDWQLTLAAYNWGVGNVRKAIARNQRDGLPTDYESLRMPQETRNYVPRLQAVKNIVIHPEAFGLTLPPLANHPYFLSVPIERDIDVDLAVELAGIGADEFKLLNPQMNKPVILAAGTPQVLLPYDNASTFVRNVERHHGPLASWTAWVATRTLRPADAARQLGVSEATLREINHIPPRMLVKAGSTLLVPRTGKLQDDVPVHVADNATMALAPETPLRRITLRASRKGDTVAAVAARYHVSAQQVADWNKTSPDASFKAGQTIAVYVPARPVKHATPRGHAAPKHAAPQRGKTAAVASTHHAGSSGTGSRVAATQSPHIDTARE